MQNIMYFKCECIMYVCVRTLTNMTYIIIYLYLGKPFTETIIIINFKLKMYVYNFKIYEIELII